MLSTMCSRRIKQTAFDRTYGPKVPLDGCACVITSRMLNALRYLPHLCLHEQRKQFAACTHMKNKEAEKWMAALTCLKGVINLMRWPILPRSHIHGSPRRLYYRLNLTDDPGNANFRTPIRIHYYV